MDDSSDMGGFSAELDEDVTLCFEIRSQASLSLLVAGPGLPR